MISLKKSQVPVYLQQGEFFRSMESEGDETLEVPADTVKEHDCVASKDDLKHLLSSLRYWIVPTVPLSAVQFVMDNDVTDLADYFTNNAQLTTLLRIKGTDQNMQMDIALRSGVLEIVQYLHDHAQEQGDRASFCPLAAKYGQLACLQFFHKQGAPWDHRTTKAAALFGQLDCLKYAIQNGCPTEDPASSNQYSEAGVLDPLHGYNFPLDDFICTVALTDSAYHQRILDLWQEDPPQKPDPLWQEGLSEVSAKNKFECLKYLHDEGCRWNKHTCRVAAASGHIAALAFLTERGCPVDEHAACFAAMQGHPECLQYTHEHGSVIDSFACSSAAQGGHIDCLRYLQAHGCPWSERVCDEATYGGHLDCLQFALEHGCVCDLDTCSAAAGEGHLNCLKYLHEAGCPWGDEQICDSAAGGGSLECLQYAHEHGCPLSNRCCESAARCGHLNCLQYVLEHGAPYGGPHVCAGAAGFGYLDIVQYLHTQGCAWDYKTCSEAAANDHLQILQYAHANGCPWERDTVARAAEFGSIQCLHYAFVNNCPYDMQYTIEQVCRQYRRRSYSDHGGDGGDGAEDSSKRTMHPLHVEALACLRKLDESRYEYYFAQQEL